MKRYSRSVLIRVSDEERVVRCKELESVLSTRVQQLQESQNFHHSVYQLIDELRSLGYDLWSYDESDEEGEEMQRWGPNYVNPQGPGLYISFYAPHRVEVSWG